MKAKTVAAALACLSCFASAFAADITWIGKGDTIATAGDWNDQANWQDETIPAAGDTAKFAKWVKISGNQTIDCNLELVSGSGAGLAIGENSTVTLNGSFDVAGGGIDVLAGGKLITKGDVASATPFGFNSNVKAAGGTWRIENANMPTGQFRCRGGVVEIATESLAISHFEYAVCKVKLDCDASLGGNMIVNNQTLEIDLNGHALTLPNNFRFDGDNAAVTVKNSQEATPGSVVYKGTADNYLNLKVCHDASAGKINVVVDTPSANLAGATFVPTDGFGGGGKWNGSLEFRKGEYAVSAVAIAQTYSDYSAAATYTAKKVRWYVHSVQNMDGSGLAASEFQLLFNGEPLDSSVLAGAAKIYKLGADGEVSGEAIDDPAGSTQKIKKMFDGDITGGSKWYVPAVKTGNTYQYGLCVEFDFGETEYSFNAYRWAGADLRDRDPKEVEMKVLDADGTTWISAFNGRQEAAEVAGNGQWHPGFGDKPEIRAAAAHLPLVATAPAKVTVDLPGETGLTASGDGELTVAAGSAPMAVTMANGVAATIKSSAETARTVNLGGALAVVGDASGLTGPVRWLKWEITASRGDSDMAIAEFELFNGGAKVAWPAGTTVSATKGAVYDNGPVERLIDGNLGINGKVYFTTANGQNKELTIALGAPVDFDGYAWYTSNDSPKRDPQAWTLSVSADGTEWFEVSYVNYAFPGDESETVPDPNNLPYGHKNQTYSLQQGRQKMVGVLDESYNATPFPVNVYGDAAATDVLDDAAAVTIPADGEMAFASAIETTGSLNGAGTLTLAGGSRLTLNVGAADGAFSGTVRGTGDGVLAIAGDGVQRLEGATLDGVKEIVLKGGTLTGAFAANSSVKVTFAGGAWGATMTMSGDAALTLSVDGSNKALFKVPAGADGVPYLKAFDAATVDDASKAVFRSAEAGALKGGYVLTRRIRGREYVLKGSKGMMIILR